MSAECPFCYRLCDDRAKICPHCTSDLRYPELAFAPRPSTPEEALERLYERAQTFTWQLFPTLILAGAFAVLFETPVLAVVAITGGGFLLWLGGVSLLGRSVRNARSVSPPRPAESQAEEIRSTNGVRWTPHRHSDQFPHVCWNCQTGCERPVAICPQCGFSGFNGEGPHSARHE